MGCHLLENIILKRNQNSIRIRVGHIQVELDFVIQCELLNVQTGDITLLVAPDHDTLAIDIVDARRVRAVVTTTAHRKVVVVGKSTGALYCSLPIGIGTQIIGRIIRQALRLDIIPVLLSIHQIKTAAYAFKSYISIVYNSGLTLPAFLGGDHDHTRSSPVTIDRSSRSIFQYVNAGDIIRCNKRNVSTRNSVDYEEGVSRAVDRGGTTKDDR